ncbi:MAG: lipopolysaccharide biosynthesis protein [Bacteroidales bacterium]|jgi:PST family polysaccharide transporter|nr:lipopolysaccharide biosynthesis protein [Bacteroidales bacterium]
MSSVKKQLISGVAYTAFSKYFGMGISLLVTAILARLISPSDFGIVAIATVIIAFFGVLGDLGIAPAVIQKKELSVKELSDIFSFTLWIGLIISICFFSFSGAVADYYKSSVLKPICRLLSVILFFNAADIVPNALLMKNKEFRFIAWRTVIIQFAGGTVSVIAAFSGAGLYALLINPIFSSIMVFVVSYMKYPQKVRSSWGLSSIKKIFSYSFYQFLFNIINFFSRNLDKLLIGKYMGMSLLGYYEKSYRLMMLPLQNITHVITPVMHPVLSDFQKDLKHLSWSYLKIVKLLAFIGIPLSVFLWFTSQEIILIVFGNQWMRAVPVFRILSITVGIQIVLSTSGSIFQAANDTKTLFFSGLLSAVLNIAGILTGIFIFGTLEAVAWCICIAFIINFIQSYILLYRFTLSLSLVPFFRQFVSPLILGCILILIFEIMQGFAAGCGTLLSFIIKGTVFFAVSLAYVQLTHTYNLRSVVLKIRDMIRGGMKKNSTGEKQ